MSTLFVSYIDLSVDLRNPFSNLTHQIVVRNLREQFPGWKGFFEKHGEYSLGFIVVTQKGTGKLTVNGPSISRKMKAVDFSIFLPDRIAELLPTSTDNVLCYLDAIFRGVSSALDQYGIKETEIEVIREKSKREIQVKK